MPESHRGSALSPSLKAILQHFLEASRHANDDMMRDTSGTLSQALQIM